MAAASRAEASAAVQWAARVGGALEATWLLTAALVPLIFVPTDFMLSEAVNAYVEVPKTTALRLLAGMMVILWILEWLLKGGIQRPPRMTGYLTRLRDWLIEQPSRWIVVAACIYITVAIITTALSQSFFISLWGEVSGQFGYSLYTTFSYFVLFAVIVTHVKTREQLYRLLTVLVATGFLVAIYGIVQRYEGDPLNVGESGSLRVASTMANSVFAGAALVGTSTLSLALGRTVLETWGVTPGRAVVSRWSQLFAQGERGNPRARRRLRAPDPRARLRPPHGCVVHRRSRLVAHRCSRRHGGPPGVAGYLRRADQHGPAKGPHHGPPGVDVPGNRADHGRAGSPVGRDRRAGLFRCGDGPHAGRPSGGTGVPEHRGGDVPLELLRRSKGLRQDLLADGLRADGHPAGGDLHLLSDRDGQAGLPGPVVPGRSGVAGGLRYHGAPGTAGAGGARTSGGSGCPGAVERGSPRRARGDSRVPSRAVGRSGVHRPGRGCGPDCSRQTVAGPVGPVPRGHRRGRQAQSGAGVGLGHSASGGRACHHNHPA